MAEWTAIRQCFRDGKLVNVGDVIDSATSPGSAFVPTSTYMEPRPTIEPVYRDPNFAVSATEFESNGRLKRGAGIVARQPTRIVGIAPHVLKY